MSSIADAIVLIRAAREARETERLVKQTEIAALTKRIEGLDTAIAVLRDIEVQPAPAAEPERKPLNLRPADAAATCGDSRTIASIAAAIGGTDETASAISAGEGSDFLGIAEALAVEIYADLPKLMETYPGGPTVRDLVLHYGTNDPRARGACKRLRDTGRANFDTDATTGIKRLIPRIEKVAA